MTTTAEGTTALDISDIISFSIQFVRCNRNPAGREAFNDLYAGDLPNWKNLFNHTSPRSETDARVVANVRNILRDMIVDDMILPEAYSTPGADDATKRILIVPFFENANYSIGYEFAGRSHTQRFSATSFETMIEQGLARSPAITDFYILVGMSHMHFSPIDADLDYQNFSHTSMDTNPIVAPAGVAASAVVASRRSSMTGPSATDIAAAVSGAVATQLQTSTSTGYGRTHHGYAGPAAIYIFNHSVLRDDIRQRYLNRLAKKPMSKVIINTAYSTDTIGVRATVPCFFYPDMQLAAGTTRGTQGLERVICADGTLFVVRSIKYSTVQKLPATKLKTNSFVGIRTWYDELMNTMHDHGVYVHPFWAFRPACTASWGFEAQNSQIEPDRDLPYELRDTLVAMSGAIYAHLSKPGTFTKESELHTLLETCPGDGYRVLKLIVLRTHPGYQEQPGVYLRQYPQQQKDESLLYFSLVFKDYLFLQGYVFGMVQSLNDEDTQDIFISSCRYANYLTRRTREKRLISAASFRQDTIVDTLTQFLESFDSPLQHDREMEKQRARLEKTKLFVKKPFSSPLGRKKVTKVNAINAGPEEPTMAIVPYQGSTEEETSDNDELFVDALESETGIQDYESSQVHAIFASKMEDIELEMMGLDMPEDSKEAIIHDRFCFAISQAKEDPKKVFVGDCIVCRKQHTFDNCPILKDHEFLKNHYIQFCQLLRKHQRSLNNTTSGETKKKSVNFVSRDSSYANKNVGSVLDEEKPISQDFQRGSRW